MLYNYLKTTLRNLWKNKIYGLINIGGLTVGMVASILLLLWVQDELSYDDFHTKAADIYRVINTSGGDQAAYNAPAALAAFASREIPEIRQAVRIIPNYGVYLFTYKDKKFTESKCALVYNASMAGELRLPDRYQALDVCSCRYGGHHYCLADGKLAEYQRSSSQSGEVTQK